jgi:plasmid replication initiation protein
MGVFYAQVAYDVTTTLTNGAKKAKDGDLFLWVSSVTVVGDPITNLWIMNT